MEFACEILSHFNCWCSASAVITFEGLCNLIRLEQFKDTIPDRIAAYVNEQKVKTVSEVEVEVLADEYVLTHKSSGTPCTWGLGSRRESCVSPAKVL